MKPARIMSLARWHGIWPACLLPLLALLAAPAGAEEPKPAFDPTELYEAQELEGWRVLVNKNFAREHGPLCQETLTLLRHQLYQIPRKAPAEAVAKLRKISIWVEEAEPHHPCMAYHPDAGWLRENSMNPDKARCVELANARNFLTWTKAQPYMVLHELAHGYHHQFLEGGFENAEIAAAFRAARESGGYEAVQHISGRSQRAYALTNPMEYFAEASEAYFGTNDFFPYVRSELQTHDPKFFALLAKLWGEPAR